MWTYNIQQIACLLCIVVLLSGCMWTQRMLMRHGAHNQAEFYDLEIDGRLYYWGLSIYYEKDEFVHAALQARLLSEEGAIEYLASKTAFHEVIDSGELRQKIKSGEIKTMRQRDTMRTQMMQEALKLRPNYFQIIDDESNEVLFEMPLEELGVNTNKRVRFSREELKEAMTRVIRERVEHQ